MTNTDAVAIIKTLVPGKCGASDATSESRYNLMTRPKKVTIYCRQPQLEKSIEKFSPRPRNSLRDDAGKVNRSIIVTGVSGAMDGNYCRLEY